MDRCKKFLGPLCSCTFSKKSEGYFHTGFHAGSNILPTHSFKILLNSSLAPTPY